MAVVAYYMYTGEQYAICAVMLAVAVAAAAAVLAPPTTAVLFSDTEGRR